MFKPCFYTTTTTMVAFLSFILSDIRLLVDFGWMMSVALGVALVLSFIVMPAGLMLLPRRYHEEENNLSRNFTHFFASLADKRGKV
ncbi:RND family transporter, partial [Idiomarina sp. HP20-50]|nr:RND family transporter [Idiomarina sp. HP20-50]